MELNELGKLLKAERLKRDISLDEIKDKTKVGVNILQAIEDGDHKKLPHKVYAKAFIKSYIAALKLDSEEVKLRFDALFPAQSHDYVDTEYKSVMTPILQSDSNPILLIGGVLLIIVLIGGAWFIFSSLHKNEPVSSVTEQPFIASNETEEGNLELESSSLNNEDEVAVQIYEQEVQNLAPVNNGSVVNNTQSINISTLATVETESNVSPDNNIEQETEQSEPEKVSGPQVMKVIAVNGDCWMRGVADGKTRDVYLKKGETATFKYNEKFQLRLGNSGAVNLKLNGQAYPVNSDGGVYSLTIQAP